MNLSLKHRSTPFASHIPIAAAFIISMASACLGEPTQSRTLPLFSRQNDENQSYALSQAVVSKAIIVVMSDFSGFAASGASMSDWERKWPVLTNYTIAFAFNRSADTDAITKTKTHFCYGFMTEDVRRNLAPSASLKPGQVELVLYQHLIEVERKIVSLVDLGPAASEMHGREEARLKFLRESLKGSSTGDTPVLSVSSDFEECQKRAKENNLFVLLVTGARDNVNEGDTLEGVARRWYGSHNRISAWVEKHGVVALVECVEPIKDPSGNISVKGLRAYKVYSQKYTAPYGASVNHPQVVLLNAKNSIQTSPISLSDPASFLRVVELLERNQ